jgi:hypothetical protein
MRRGAREGASLKIITTTRDQGHRTSRESDEVRGLADPLPIDDLARFVASWAELAEDHSEALRSTPGAIQAYGVVLRRIERTLEILKGGA